LVEVLWPFGLDHIIEHKPGSHDFPDTVAHGPMLFEVLDDLVEPEWPKHLDQEWGGWGPERGALVPGTAIFVGHRP